MALPKKGIRKIEYEGHTYGWLIRSKPTYTQGAFQSPMTIGIQELDCEMPKVLYVTLNIDRPDNWLSSHQTQITQISFVILLKELSKKVGCLMRVGRHMSMNLV